MKKAEHNRPRALPVLFIFHSPFSVFHSVFCLLSSLCLCVSVVRSRLPNHVAQQIDTAVRVAPLVVVPANELEEATVQLDARAGVEDARVLIVDEVAGD